MKIEKSMKNLNEKSIELFKMYPEEFKKESFFDYVSQESWLMNFVSLAYMLMPRFFVQKDFVLNYINSDADFDNNEILCYKNGVNKELKEKYPEKVADIDEVYKNPEALTNLLEVHSLFHPYDEKLTPFFHLFLETMIKFWKLKLNLNFPYREFEVMFIHDELHVEDQEEYYLTFKQINTENLDSDLKDTKCLTDLDYVFEKAFWLWGEESPYDLDKFYDVDDNRYYIATRETELITIASLNILIPEIIDYENCVVLRERVEVYKEVVFENTTRLIRSGYFDMNKNLKGSCLENKIKSKKEIEQFHNRINLESFFKHEDLEYNKKHPKEYLVQVQKLGRILRYYWQLRLKELFPEKSFEFSMFKNLFNEKGYFLTFWEADKQ